jgi:hypothetical protein
MIRASLLAPAFALAACAHLPTPTPLPPQDPQESQPIIILMRDPRPAATPKPRKTAAPKIVPTPDVVAIGWSLRDTLVWDGRSVTGKTVRRVPRRQTVSENDEPQGQARNRARSRVFYSAAMQCGNRNRGYRVGFSARRCGRDCTVCGHCPNPNAISRHSHPMWRWKSARHHTARPSPLRKSSAIYARDRYWCSTSIRSRA